MGIYCSVYKQRDTVFHKGHRPLTKLQQKCADLLQFFPPLTEKQYLWARSKMQPLGYSVTRGRKGRDSAVWCQECGQMDVVGMSPLYVSVANPKHVCSHCGRKLDVRNWNSTKKDAQHNFLFGIIARFNDMQVVRVFNIHQDNMMGNPTIETVEEVFDVFFDVRSCKETIISRPYSRNYNYFYWHTHLPMKVASHNGGGGGYYLIYDVYDISKIYIYPHMSIHPLLRRNGWKDRMASKINVSPVDIWKNILTDRDMEALAKWNQLPVMEYWFNTGSYNRDKSRWLHCVKICSRHGYIIKDASMWFDLLDSLIELGLDIHSPHYICPDDLKAMHDIMQRRVSRKREQDKIQEAKNHEISYAKKKGKYFNIQFDNGNIFLHVISSVQEMAEEGKHMHHCVYDREYYKKPDSLILSARDRGGNRLETVEVSLRTFTVVQSRGLQNNPTTAHAEIVRLIEENMNLIRKAKETKSNKQAI